MSGNPVSRFFRALGGNLVAAVLMLVFRRSALRWLKATPAQFLLMLALSLGASFCFDYINEGQPGAVQPLGFAAYLMPPFFMTAFGVWLSHRYAAWRLALAPVVIWLGADMLLGFIVLAVQAAGQRWLPPQAVDYVSWVYLALFFWPVLATVALFGRAVGWGWFQDGVVAAMVLLLFFAWFLKFSDQRMWEATEDETQAEEVAPRITEEQAFYAQPELLQEATDALQSGRAGQVHWYFVGVAGDSYQNVFLREVQWVRRYFDKHLHTAGRSVELINNDETVMDDPIASRTGLERVLQSIGQKMGPDDVLFLLMSSHGSQDHEFELSYDPLQLDPITPDWLRHTLDAAGIQRRVIAISACFSGGFLPALETPDSIVMTASDATHASFGCSDTADFTYFGKALFHDALPHQHSIEGAFSEARQALAAREKVEGFTPSNPQLFIGEDIRRQQASLDASLFAPNP